MMESKEDTHVELAVVDKIGRIQLPREYLDSIGLTSDSNKLEVMFEDGKIVILNPKDKHV
ncbi:hypothetical protein JCM21714_1008 [Gracilibacillus boraciitolerans JCM 21714]|uniref:SpoVT-AbrB domain-containing protein n=1 Tax=Gracilibacillus boraciitolerans JCM 21714 TaxID=1298598 RepID=W4VFV3_9BACI|nr:hypothetical protein JCM21714_1008 [Gracilibacillus boraciitolerans JCM 21714]